MAKDLQAFQKEFTAIQQALAKAPALPGLQQRLASLKKEFEAADEAMEKSGHNRGHLDHLTEEGARAVGDRVRELREKGMPGQTLDDFKGDPEVRELLKHLSEFMDTLDKHIAELRALATGPWKQSVLRHNALEADVAAAIDVREKLETRLATLKKELDAEVKARSKQLTTKVGVGNKSLPDMKKLQATVDKTSIPDLPKLDDMLAELKDRDAMTKQMKLMRDYLTTSAVMKKPDTYRTNLEGYLKQELAKSKDKAVSQEQNELFARLLVDRNINKYTNQVRVLNKEVLQHIADAKAALFAKNNSELQSAKINAARQFKTLNAIVTKYEEARRTIGENAIGIAKNARQIQDSYKVMIDLRDTSKKELDAIANAKVK
jgi:hypothetical protein